MGANCYAYVMDVKEEQEVQDLIISFSLLTEGSEMKSDEFNQLFCQANLMFDELIEDMTYQVCYN